MIKCIQIIYRKTLKFKNVLILILLIFPLFPGFAVEVYNVSSYPNPQSAIDAAKIAGGGLVRFPCGNVLITSMLVIDQKGITLEGCGVGGTTLVSNFSSGAIIKFGNNITPFAECGGIRNLTITSNLPRTSGYALVISGCEQGIIENIRISTNGGNGIRFSNNTNENSSLFFIRAVDIEIKGAFTAIKIKGSNDRYFSDLWLRGDETAGSRGIVIERSGGDWFKDIESVLFEVGISINPQAEELVKWINFNNVLTDQNTLYGFDYAGEGDVNGISCNRCWASSNGKLNIIGRGIRIYNGYGLSFNDSRVINNGGHGFEALNGTKDIEISGGIFAGNCRETAGCEICTSHGIIMTGTDGFRISGVRSGKSAGIPVETQGYGIFINSGCNNFIVSNSDTRLNYFGGILNVPGVSSTRILNSNL